MSLQNTFNKEAFAMLLAKAKGNRSINQYASETTVSSAHISRFLRQLLDAPPSPETIAKFAFHAENDVFYQDLMVAAGHLMPQSSDTAYSELITSSAQKYSPINVMRKKINLEKKFFQVIVSSLYMAPFKWHLEQSPDEVCHFPHMTITMENGVYKRWYIVFKSSMEDKRSAGAYPYHLLGQIAVMALNASDKVTVVVSHEGEFNQLFSVKPDSLKANVFVMLINLEENEIVKEEQLCWF